MELNFSEEQFDSNGKYINVSKQGELGIESKLYCWSSLFGESTYSVKKLCVCLCLFVRTYVCLFMCVHGLRYIHCNLLVYYIMHVVFTMMRG